MSPEREESGPPREAASKVDRSPTTRNSSGSDPQIRLQVCIACDQQAGFKTPTGHPVCAEHANTGPTLSDTLDDLSAFIARYIAFTSDPQLVAVTLWAAHTHIAHRLRTTPYLHITSPEPESGKSQLLDVLELVVFNPWLVVLPSPAVLFRKIDKAKEDGGLTLLLDEVDPIFKRGSDESGEALRAVLNSGYRRGEPFPGASVLLRSWSTSPCTGRKLSPVSERCPTPSHRGPSVSA